MTTFSLDELVQPLTPEQVKEKWYQFIAARGINTTTWKPGGVTRTVIAGGSIIVSVYSELQAEFAKGGFLDLAESAWLKLKARHDYDVEADEGSFATGVVQLDNTAGAVHSGGPGDLVVQNSSTGKTYRNTEAYSIGALETGVMVDVQATEIGTASNAAPGEVDSFVTSLSGVTVTNPNPIIGSDEETPESIRQRSRDKTGTLSPNGPADAYRFIAQSTLRPDGTSIGVTRVRPVPDGVGGVDVYLATASGNIPGDSEDPETDLGIIHDAIVRAVEPISVTARTQSATPKPIAIEYVAWVSGASGLTAAEVEADIAAALGPFMAQQRIGGTKLPGDADGKVFRSAIHDAIWTAVPGMISLNLIAPAADETLDPEEAPILDGAPTATVHIVGGAL